jgi:hypothetical protein
MMKRAEPWTWNEARASGSWGFDFRYLRSLRGAMRPHYTPKLKKRTALVGALKEVFGRHRSQAIERVIALINPVLRGWVNYFAVGHSSECLSFIKDWVEKKVSRRHLAHAQKRKGFGWERWNRRWLYDIECDATGRKSPRQDRSHKLWREANGGAQCRKSPRCVRRGGGWRRGVGRDPRATPARSDFDSFGPQNAWAVGTPSASAGSFARANSAVIAALNWV